MRTEVKIAALRDEVNATINKAKAEKRELTPAETIDVDKKLEQISALVTQKDAERVVSDVAASMIEAESGKTPAVAKRQVRGFDSAQQAYDSGKWLQAHFSQDPIVRAKAMDHCQMKGLIQASMTSLDNTLGGFLVPNELSNAIYAQRLQYSVARQECQVIEMDSAVLDIPRLETEVQASFVGENSTITPNNPSIGQMRIEPKKVAAMTVFSNEIGEDALVGVVEMLTGSIAYSFAKIEDACLFLGDGTSVYGGISGLPHALAAGSRITATGRTTYAALTFADFENVLGRTRRHGANLKWYMSRTAWSTACMRLLNAAGGASATELSEGVVQYFLGHPVVIVEDMHSNTGTSTGSIAAFFGDLRQGVMFGSRRNITAKVDESRYLEIDATALRVTQRFDIVVANRGTASEAGGITALIFG